MRSRCGRARAALALSFLSATAALLIFPPRSANEAPSGNRFNSSAPPVTLQLHLRRHGLCNRLRSFAAAHILAADLGVALDLDWQREASCNVTFGDLFAVDARADAQYAAGVPSTTRDVPGVRVLSDAFGPHNAGGVCMTDAREKHTRLASLHENFGHGTWGEATHVLLHASKSFVRSGDYHKLSAVARSDAQRRRWFLHMTTDTPNVPEHVNCTTFFERKAAIYRALVPTGAVLDAFHHVAAHLKSLAERYIGVHFRSHDNVHDYPVVPAPGGKVNFGDPEASPLDGVIALLRRLQRANPDTVFFLSTNDCSGAVASKLKSSLGRATLVVARDLLTEDVERWATVTSGYCDGLGEAAPRSSASARAALLDWWLLAHADLIVGTHWSSFTEEAQVMHNAPLLTIVAGQHIAMLPSTDTAVTCGYPPFLNRFLSGQPGPLAASASFEDYLRTYESTTLTDALGSFRLAQCAGPQARKVTSEWGIEAHSLYCVDERPLK